MAGGRSNLLDIEAAGGGGSLVADLAIVFQKRLGIVKRVAGRLRGESSRERDEYREAACGATYGHTAECLYEVYHYFAQYLALACDRMRSYMMLRQAFALIAIVAMAAVCGRGQTAAIYTAGQADDGRAVYLANCASCHLADLAGRNEAPPLAGGNFMNAWGARTTTELIRYMQENMPPANRGGLSEDTYANIAGFLMQANGAPAGTRPLAAATPVRIGSAANGQMPAALRETLSKEATADQSRASRTTMPKGLTVTGQVKSYVPVTDGTLRNPNPADWLMARGNYQSWSYSPLTQITPENLGRLQLAWVWAMNDGGANEPTPIVHDGIIYLTNTSNTLQALDGRTGELIWENRIGPEATVAYGATRTLAIYEDKLLLATPDARLYALDARTGKIVWQTAIAPDKLGYSNTSGAIVVNGKVLTGMTGCGRYGADCYISAYDARNGEQVWRFRHDCAAGRSGRRHVGRTAESVARGGRYVDCRQLRPRAECDVLGRGAAQAVAARQPRRQARR